MEGIVITTAEDAKEYLSKMIGKPLQYALKSPDLDLYDFGFGGWIQTINRKGRLHTVTTYSIHAQCPLKVIWRNGTGRADLYDGDTDSHHFHKETESLLGLPVKRVELSDKNDLWVDLGDYWIVFISWENDEESWRYFLSGGNDPHLVASNKWLELHN